VMRGIACLKKHGVEFNTLTVVHRHNASHPLEVYRFLRETGSGFMQFIPIVERTADHPLSGSRAPVSSDFAAAAQVSEFSVEPLPYGKFLCALFDEWVRHDVGTIFVQLFDEALAAWAGMNPHVCVFQQTCGSAAVIEHNGDIYSCDHYVYPGRFGSAVTSRTAFPASVRNAGCVSSVTANVRSTGLS
jgi:uncharacterized protein